MKFILGKKVEMTELFDEAGVMSPVTIISVIDNVVTGLKTMEQDGYKAVKVGFGIRRPKNIKKPQLGEWKDLGNFAGAREIRVEASEESTLKKGDKIEIGTFAEGDVVEVSAISKGKGFQGVVKRHGFGGGPRSHGQSHSEREPGSIGGGLRNKVPKGMRMPGRMGGTRITVKNLKIMKIDAGKKWVFIKGAIPGRRGTVVEIKA